MTSVCVGTTPSPNPRLTALDFKSLQQSDILLAITISTSIGEAIREL